MPPLRAASLAAALLAVAASSAARPAAAEDRAPLVLSDIHLEGLTALGVAGASSFTATTGRGRAKSYALSDQAVGADAAGDAAAAKRGSVEAMPANADVGGALGPTSGEGRGFFSGGTSVSAGHGATGAAASASAAGTGFSTPAAGHVTPFALPGMVGRSSAR